jgi:hypothetical protein
MVTMGGADCGGGTQPNGDNGWGRLWWWNTAEPS